jgi:hypothetical protein
MMLFCLYFCYLRVGGGVPGRAAVPAADGGGAYVLGRAADSRGSAAADVSCRIAG